MFSSNPFSEPPSSPNVFFPPSFVVDHEKDCVSFNYHLNNSDPFFSGDCFFYTHNSTLAPPSPVNENITTFNQQFSEVPLLQSSEDHDELIDLVISCSKKKTGESKKDGHSKIYTAHGPRDRRVRLSIDISRKFFCLQDLLGFDKASKTLDWLFVKCKTAIKELVEDTNRCSSSTATDDQSKMNFLESILGGLDEKKGQKKKSISKYADGKSKKITQKHRGGFQENLSREQSRGVARALARERAREKMRIKKLDDELKTSVVLNHFDYQNLETVTGEYHRLISASSLESINGGAGVIL